MKNKWMKFEEARRFSRKLGLSGYHSWIKYCHSGNKPDNIPMAPHVIYKEWINWMDWLKTQNVVGCVRKHKVNDDYFKKWSHNMSYILGFWFADGCIMSGNIFKIAQHKNDRYILEQISKCMRSNYKIISDGNMCGIRVVSKTIYDDIVRLGGKERKSLNVKFPKIPPKYLPDFIRGLWDGDGCISIYKNHDINSVMTSGSKGFIKSMLKTLEININGLRGRIVKTKYNKISGNGYSTAYRIVLSANNSRILRDYMYRYKGLFLKRKYDKFLKIGPINIASYDRKYWSYKKARLYARKLGLKKWSDWFLFSKSDARPIHMPSNPWKVYKNNGWVGSREFFGF